MGKRKCDFNPYGIAEVGDKKLFLDYENFKHLCSEVGKELGLSGDEIYRIYSRFVDRSVQMLLPEPDLNSLTDEQLLTPRRVFQIPYVCRAEVTRKSLNHFRMIMKVIQDSKRRKNNNTKEIE
jgi:hypothetical protein